MTKKLFIRRNVFHSFRSDQGFTLMDLMISISIIGVLAAVASTMYSGFQAKSRDSEAKLALSAVYTAEQAHSAEDNSFTKCMHDLLGVPTWNRNFAVGFKAATTTGPEGVGQESCDPFTAAPYDQDGTVIVANRSPSGDAPVTFANFPAGSGNNYGVVKDDDFQAVAVTRPSSDDGNGWVPAASGGGSVTGWAVNSSKTIIPLAAAVAQSEPVLSGPSMGIGIDPPGPGPTTTGTAAVILPTDPPTAPTLPVSPPSAPCPPGTPDCLGGPGLFVF